MVKLIKSAEKAMWKKDADVLLFCSFRYALGRQSYITEWIGENLLKYAHLLNDNTKHKIIEEIEEAVNKGEAGQEIDEEMWKFVALKLGGEVKCK